MTPGFGMLPFATLAATAAGAFGGASASAAFSASDCGACPLQRQLLDTLDLDARESRPINLTIASTNLPVVGRRQGEGAAFTAGTAGAADAMDIVLSMDRHIEIEHMAHADDVEAAGGDIAGDQERDLAV